ncbi:MAG TPA: DUF2269 family protein [Dehalococcoidia bacterium]|nr:DUF2269 family protein [Dehalococcoidia bacterium]
MPHAYEIGLFIHLLAVFLLGGATALSFVTFSMMRRAKTVQEVRVWGGLGRILSQYYVLPATALALVLSGAYLVSKSNSLYDWGASWISWSLLAIIVAVGVGLGVVTPRMKAAGAAAGQAPDGAVPASIGEMLSDPVLFAAIHGNMMITVAIIWEMTTKPGSVGAVLAVVILGGIGAASAIPMYLRQRG